MNEWIPFENVESGVYASIKIGATSYIRITINKTPNIKCPYSVHVAGDYIGSYSTLKDAKLCGISHLIALLNHVIYKLQKEGLDEDSNRC